MAEGVQIPINLNVNDIDFSNMDASGVVDLSKQIQQSLRGVQDAMAKIFETRGVDTFAKGTEAAMSKVEASIKKTLAAQAKLVTTMNDIAVKSDSFDKMAWKVKDAESQVYALQEQIAYIEKNGMVGPDTWGSSIDELRTKLEAAKEELRRVKQETSMGAVVSDANLAAKEFGKLVTAATNLAQTFGEAQTAARNLNAELQKETPFTEKYETMSKNLQSLQEKMQKLLEKSKEMEALGATDKAWAKAEYEAQKLSTETESLIRQMRELVKTGEAFRFGSDDNSIKEQMKMLRSASGVRSGALRAIQERTAANRPQYTDEYAQQLKSIQALENELTKLEEKAKRFHELGATRGQWDNLAYDVDNLRGKIDQAKDSLIQMIQEGKAFRFGGNAEVEIGQVEQRAGELVNRLGEINTAGRVSGKTVEHNFTKANERANSLLRTIGKLIKAFATLGHTSKKNSGDMEKSLKRLWKNFLMFGLGFRSMYFFVKKLRTTFINEFKLMAQSIPEVNEQISSFMTHVNQMKGTLGTAFQPLMKVVIPALNALVDALTRAMEAMGRFWATIVGQGYIYKYTANQVDYAKSLENTGKAAEKARRSLMGFDEINRLDADKAGSGAGTGDEEGHWEKTPAEGAFSKLADLMKKGWAKSDWTEVGDYIAEGLQGALDRATKKLRGSIRNFTVKVATVLGTGINGFVEKEGLGKSLGTTIGAAFNTVVATIDTFFDVTHWKNVGKFLADTLNSAFAEADFSAAGDMLASRLSSMIDLAWSFVTNINFEQAGQKLSDAINGFFERMSEVDETGLNGWQKLGQTISTTISGLATTISTALEGVDWDAVGQAIGDFLSSIDWSQVILDLGNLAVRFFEALCEAMWGWYKKSPLTATIGTILGVSVLGIKVTPGILKSVSAFKKLGEVFKLVSTESNTLREALTKVFGATATNIMGIASIVGGALLAISNFISMLTDGFSWVKEALMLLGIALVSVGAIIMGAPALVAGVIAGIVSLVATLVVLIVQYWDEIVAFLKKVWEGIVQTLVYIGKLIWAEIQTVTRTIGGIIEGLVYAVVGMFEGLWESIKGIWEGIKKVFMGILEFISGVFTANWKKAWEGIKDIVGGIWKVIVSVIKSPINLIIGLINGMLKGICNGINFAIRGLNKLSFDVPDWVPVIGGEKWGFNISELSAPQIPYLANGAVIPPNKQFLAMLGDQKSGTNVEAPLSTIQEAVAEVMGDQLEALAAIGEAIIEAINNKDLNLRIGDREIGQAANRYNSRQNIIRG